MGEPDSEAGRTRVVVVDDHRGVRVGISAALLTVSDIELVGEAADEDEALRVCQQAQPDVVLMDLKLPGVDGITAIRELRERDPEVRILALTSFPDDYWVQEALLAGATGYLLKNLDLETLVAAIRATRQGRTILPPEAGQALDQADKRSHAGE